MARQVKNRLERLDKINEQSLSRKVHPYKPLFSEMLCTEQQQPSCPCSVSPPCVALYHVPSGNAPSGTVLHHLPSCVENLCCRAVCCEERCS